MVCATSRSECKTIVIDYSSKNLKLGFAGDGSPLRVYPHKMPYPLHGKFDPSCLHDAFSRPFDYPRKGMCLRDVIKDGEINDFDALKCLIEELMQKEYQSDTKQCNFIICEPNRKIKNSNKKSGQFFFDEISAKAIFFAESACLSSFSQAKTSSLVLDASMSGSVCVPVYEGSTMREQLHRSPLGFDYISQECKKLFDELKLDYEPQDIRNFKKIHPEVFIDDSFYNQNFQTELYSFCDIVLEFAPKSLNHYTGALPSINHLLHSLSNPKLSTGVQTPLPSSKSEIDSKVEYAFPNRTCTHTFGIERFKIPEAIFDPSSIQNSQRAHSYSSALGLTPLIMNTINLCKPVLKNVLVNNFAVFGETSLLRGFYTRLASELNSAVGFKMLSTKPRRLNSNSLASTFDENLSPGDYTFDDIRNAAWVGGSIIGSFDEIDCLYTTIEDFKENGAEKF